MKNRKDNKITLFTLFVIIITIIALIATSGTYAKYTDSVSATSTAVVAKWSVTANDVDMHEENSIDFNIFDTILDSDMDENNPETNVDQPNSGFKKIAPGTSGYKELEIENNSDVDIDLSIEFEVDDDSPNIPIEFALVSGNSTPDPDTDFYNPVDFTNYIAGTLEDPANPGQTIEPNVTTTINYGTSGNTATYKLYWRWAYEGSALGADVADTNLGASAADTQHPLDPYIVTVTLTATQVD